MKSISIIPLALLTISLLSSSVLAQTPVCPPQPSGFGGLNSSSISPDPDNQAILEIFTPNNSTDVFNNDNMAETYLGAPVRIVFSDARVPAGSPFSLSYSVGVPATPLVVPTIVDGDIWLDIGNPSNYHNLVDGLALDGYPDPLGRTSGPAIPNVLDLATTSDPGAIGACVTFQVLVSDPVAPSPYFITFSNPVGFGIAPGIGGFSPNVSAPNGVVSVLGGGQTPAGGDLLFFEDGTNTVTSAGGAFATAPGASSGRVTGLFQGYSVLTGGDTLEDFLPIIDYSNQSHALTAGILNLNPDSNLAPAGSSRATGTGTVTSGGTQTWSVSLAAGDIVEIEVFSTNAAYNQVLDGRGSLLNPYVTEGFDPFVILQQNTSADPLVWDGAYTAQGVVPPHNLIEDDDDGPANNSFVRWQAKYTGVYNIIVADANASAFVTGDYILNLKVATTVPCVSSFGHITSSNRVNMVAQTGSVRVNGPNILSGRSYDVTLIPKEGTIFASRVIPNVAATQNGQLVITIPLAGTGELPIGLHQVQLTDLTTGLTGDVWDNSDYSPVDGVLPDLLCLVGQSQLNATLPNSLGGNSNQFALTNLNNQSVIFLPPALSTNNLAGGFILFTTAPGVSVLYAEALGMDDQMPGLFDTGQPLSGTNNGVYNPLLRGYELANILSFPGPINDNDGVIPYSMFPRPMGIGANAAILDTSLINAFPNSTQFFFSVFQDFFIGPTNGNHTVMVNIVAL